MRTPGAAGAALAAIPIAEGGGPWVMADAVRWVRARVKGSRSSFFWAMRLLPRPRRDAMFAVYAFCRCVDDIADGTDSPEAKAQALMVWRREVGALFLGMPTHPAMIALIPAVRQFGLRQRDFLAVIDGMDMDVAGRMVAPRLEDLDRYCDRAAGAVGLLSAPIFGLPEAEGRALARALGRAVQLTNVLRDLAADAEEGRLYLPDELLARYGIAARTPELVIAEPAVAEACADLAASAGGYFAEARRIIGACPRGPARPARIILAVYARLLDKLTARGIAPAAIATPARLGRWQKLVTVARACV